MSGGLVGLRFDPIGGGQFKEAVKQMIQSESRPLHLAEGRKAKEQARQKLFQEFKSKFTGLDSLLQELSSFRKFRILKADVGMGGDLMSVTLDQDRAEPGRYDIEIDQLADRTSLITNGFESPTDPTFGMGFIAFYTVDGDEVDVSVEDKDSSLYGISSAINRSSKAPMTAAVVKDVSEPDAPWKLILSAKKDGEANQLDYPDFYFYGGDDDIYIDDDQESDNAEVSVDGFDIESESNDIKDFLLGINAHLKAADSDKPFTLSISEDYEKISSKVKGIIDKINQVLDFIVKQNTIDEHSDTSTTFAGDLSLQTIEYRLRNLIHEEFPAGDPDDEDDDRTLHLSQLGIEFDKSGHLNFKQDKFQKSLEDDFVSVAQGMVGPSGFISQMRDAISAYTQLGDGLLSIKEQAMQQRMKDIDGEIDEQSRLLDQKQQQIVDRFSRLESTLGNLQRQQQYLSASLPSGGGGNIVSQLLG